MNFHARYKACFTLIELLIVVAIIAILAAIATMNFLQANRRALKSADAANMKALGSALQIYYVDYGTLPLADRNAGPAQSWTEDATGYGNGPAAGGSLDGVPWILFERGYIGTSDALFTNVYIKKFRGGTTIRGGFPRFHNFRYAYNSASLSSGGHTGGISGDLMQGNVWIVRNLHLNARDGFYGARYPSYPADYTYPWGEGNDENKLEHVMYSDMSVRTVYGGADNAP